MAIKDIKLNEGIRNIDFDVKSSDISVYSDRVDAPIVRCGDNFEVLELGNSSSYAKIKETGNGNDSSIIIRGNGNCSINIGSNNVIRSRTIICGNGVTIYGRNVYGNIEINDNEDALNGECTSVELILPKKYENFSIGVQSKAGNLNIEDTILARLIANTMSGDITLRDIDIMFASLKTMSGDIKAEILESIINYRIALKTKSGSINQSNVEEYSPIILQSKRELETNTMSGDISLIFKGKKQIQM